LRRLRRHARPGVRRRRRRDAGDERGGRRDEGSRRPLRRHGRRHAVLLHVGRADGVGGGRARHADPVPRLGRRSVRHGVAVPRLGARAVRRREGRREAEGSGAAGRRHGDARSVRPRADAHGHRRRRLRVDVHGRPGAGGARPALDVVHAVPVRARPDGDDDHLRRRRVPERRRAGRRGRFARGEAVREGLGRRRAGRASRRRQLLDDRQAAGADVVPSGVGARPGGTRDGARRAAGRRDDLVARRTGDRTSGGRRRGGPAPAVVRGRVDDRVLDRDGRDRRVLVRRAARARRVPRPLRAGRWAAAGPLGHGLGAVRRLLLLALCGAALVAASTASAFDNTEPLAARQWYLTRDSAWDFWDKPPTLTPVKVAVIDSGVDGGHPDLQGRIVAARSFVGGSPYRDDEGHGTFVAGEIAANPFNGIGIAGVAFNARLIVAKVVEPDGTVSLSAEVAAIRWAVREGAQVINLSLGGVRDPLDPQLDTYSPLEQAAVEYAYSKGAVVVAAVGNGPQSPATPWDFAHYPAALPHVIGVSAMRQDGSIPAYSNRDAVFNDIAAPGDNIFSTIPRDLSDPPATCADGPYSDCGPFEF